ncbi:MAG: trypsin-like peptidase domain-containing protein, partial [Gammaproteobacteria bacterium]
MSDEIATGSSISPELQPDPAALDYDLEHALSAIVSVRSRVPDDAFTAQILGTERAGHAVRIDDNGLLVTIGYVIAEAEEIWLIADNGHAVPGHVVGYDYETGFGLIQTLGRMALPIIELGDSDVLTAGQSIVV